MPALNALTPGMHRVAAYAHAHCRLGGTALRQSCPAGRCVMGTMRRLLVALALVIGMQGAVAVTTAPAEARALNCHSHLRTLSVAVYSGQIRWNVTRGMRLWN